MSIANTNQYLWEGGYESTDTHATTFKVTLIYDDNSEEIFFENAQHDLTEDDFYASKLLAEEGVVDFYIELEGVSV
ncbi:hypothetical protein KMW28_17865 [Flammeovirga yaeyamensis]|uniref:Phage protein n=1 Tax=Flammeovirga yaeyamensis TaxID=367791 RepID=A0AAX1N1X2_9BACT|nr:MULTISPECIES: hypothetical protein [Flammeovirga]ANQ51082.1 hypothetical protein MY04_3738 [Flammeovirga sp. MY04]MBB3698109.1 hypothetical protein [Flammeovirga yaeyamensis]NMF34532.1 hypothetical protein [Flammeovirga yaeyamensis]QWG01509.1 hypothetical protein KMW28_17865 [Flammeovirga yaeyamensis]